MEITASVNDGGTTVAQGSARVEPAGDTELVGLLPGVLAGRPVPGVAPLAVDAGTAQFSAVDEGDLAVPGALASLDVLGVAPGELASLGAEATGEVLDWVAAGGHLMADDAAGAEVAGLPASWQPGPDGRSRAGLGEVRLVGGAMAAGTFAGLVEPTTRERSGSEMFGSGEPIDAALARDAGLRVPELGWLVGFLLAYVLVAVPVTLTVLRRLGRGELGWIVLPLVSLAFTGAGYLAGRDLRDGATTAHGTVLVLSDAGGQATTSVGVVSNGGGRVTTSFPTGWSAASAGNQWFGPQAPVVAARTNEGVELRQRLDAGAFGVAAARGPVSVDGGLEVTATTTGDRMTGTVRSTLPFDLEDVAAFQGLDGTLVGTLPSGGEATFELPLNVNGDPFQGAARRVWSDAAGFDRPPDPTSVVAFPLWERFEAEAPSGFRSTGSVVVAGWTRDFTPPVEAAGELEGRTLVVTTADTTSGGRSVTARTQPVRLPLFGQGNRIVWRFVLPEGDGGTADGLVVRAPQGRLDLEIWSDGAWQPLPPPLELPEGEPQLVSIAGPLADHPVPEGAAGGGPIWVRGTLRDGQLDPMLGAAADFISVRRLP